MNTLYWTGLLDRTGLLAAEVLLGQAGPGQAPADTPGAQPPSDFRFHVWLAYGLVLALLALFTLWSAAQSRAASRKAEQLREMVERSRPQSG